MPDIPLPSGIITSEDLNHEIINESVFAVWEPKRLDEVIKEHVLLSYAHHEKNKARTARSLGVTQKSLYNWFNKWGLGAKSNKEYHRG